MADPDDLLDADAAAANRRDTRSAVIITTASLGLVIVASLLVVAGDFAP